MMACEASRRSKAQHTTGSVHHGKFLSCLNLWQLNSGLYRSVVKERKFNIERASTDSTEAGR